MRFMNLVTYCQRLPQPLACLPAAFTRLLPNSGQPLYGWLAKFHQSLGSPLQRASGSEFVPNPFHLESFAFAAEA